VGARSGFRQLQGRCPRGLVRADPVPDVTIRGGRAEFGELCTWAVDFWPSRGRERRFVTLCTLWIAPTPHSHPQPAAVPEPDLPADCRANVAGRRSRDARRAHAIKPSHLNLPPRNDRVGTCGQAIRLDLLGVSLQVPFGVAPETHDFRGFLQCAREDSNLHGPFSPQGPQPCASTNSATGAWAASIDLPRESSGRRRVGVA
jgi:hypothetical protein